MTDKQYYTKQEVDAIVAGTVIGLKKNMMLNLMTVLDHVAGGTAYTDAWRELEKKNGENME